MDQKEINKILKNHEQRILVLERRDIAKKIFKAESWYRLDSTIGKIIILIKEGFFNKPKGLKEIISRLKEKDFHLNASDLTLPLRKIVRKGLLEKTNKLPDGSISNKWLYKKA